MSNLEKIEVMWSADCVIPTTDLIGASHDIPKLHSKYHQLLNKAKSSLIALESAHSKMRMLKNDYYLNMLDKDTLKELGWIPNKRVILKADLSTYISGDADIINVTEKIQEVKICIDFLESIIRHINSRQFIIKNIIENEKFINGSN